MAGFGIARLAPVALCAAALGGCNDGQTPQDAIDPASITPGHFVELWVGDRFAARVPASVGVLEDGRTKFVNADFPSVADDVTRIDVIAPDGARRLVSPDTVRRPVLR